MTYTTAARAPSLWGSTSRFVARAIANLAGFAQALKTASPRLWLAGFPRFSRGNFFLQPHGAAGRRATDSVLLALSWSVALVGAIVAPQLGSTSCRHPDPNDRVAGLGLALGEPDVEASDDPMGSRRNLAPT